MTVGTSLVFPAGLPCPQELPTQSAERRVLNDALTEARVGQTDRLDYEDYVFPPYSPAQALTLDEFWRVTLNKGGKWFSTLSPHWPRPEGRTPAARRFIGPPRWEFIHTGKSEIGYWRVSGTFEVRGVGELPVEPDPPSAWNPLDMMSAQALPVCVDLTEDYRLATRNTVLPDNWESGVRGERSRGGIAGQRFYLELEIVSVGSGIPSANQGMQCGLIDGVATNILSRPPPSNSSQISNLTSNVALAFARLDGATGYRTVPGAFITNSNTFVDQMAVGHVFGFDWIVGTSIAISRNGAVGLTVATAFVGMLFPYFSAGATTVDATNFGTSESVRIRTGKKQQLYRPAAAIAWG